MTASSTSSARRNGSSSDGCPAWCDDHDHGGPGEHRTALVEWSGRPGYAVSLRQPVGEVTQLYISWGEEIHQQADIGDRLSTTSPAAGVTGDELLELGLAILRAGTALLGKDDAFTDRGTALP